MNILVLQETDWLTRGPHTQHHIFERLSKNISLNITILDYDIDKIQRSNSLLKKRKVFLNINRAINNSKVKIIRTAHIQVPYIRRISSLITNFFEILKIIRINRPDIIIGFSMSNGLIGLILSKLFKIPYVFFCMDILHELVVITQVQKIARIVSRISLKKADQVIVHTMFQRIFFIKEGASPQNIRVLLTGMSMENTVVDVKKFKKLKKKLFISDDDFIILFMGYLYDFAGLIEIIDFYNHDVKSNKINLKFLILGDGGIYNHLVNHVKKIGAEWVILTGKVPFLDITEYISLADLCLLSFKLNKNTKDIIPIKVIEYMAMKKPVLSTSLPGVVYEFGKNEGVIFTKNQEELIRKIADLIPQKEDLRKLGEKGFELVKTKYVWSNVIKDFKEILIDVIKNK
ncbi:MAG: glycosyltransferase [Promethearchaeota archaeon]